MSHVLKGFHEELVKLSEQEGPFTGERPPYFREAPASSNIGPAAEVTEFTTGQPRRTAQRRHGKDAQQLAMAIYLNPETASHYQAKLRHDKERRVKPASGGIKRGGSGIVGFAFQDPTEVMGI